MVIIKRKRAGMKIVAGWLLFFFSVVIICPKDVFASRSDAGGGEVAEFEFSDFALAVGMSLGSAIIGSAIGSALSSGWGSMSSSWSLSNLSSTANQMGQLAEEAANGINTAENLTKIGNLAQNIGDLGKLGETGASIAQNVGSIGEWARTAGDIALQQNAALQIGYLVGNMSNTISGISSVSSGVFSSAGSGFLSYFANNFSNMSNAADVMAKGFVTFGATTQVVRAVSTMGSYYEWNPRLTYALASVASGITSGFLNPDVSLGKQNIWDPSITSVTRMLNPPVDVNSFLDMAKGAFVGALGQGASSGVIVLIDGAKIARNENPGALAQLAGFVAGLAATNIGRYVVNVPAQLVSINERATASEVKSQSESSRIEWENKAEYFRRFGTLPEFDDIGTRWERMQQVWDSRGGLLSQLQGGDTESQYRGLLSKYFNPGGQSLYGSMFTGDPGSSGLFGERSPSLLSSDTGNLFSAPSWSTAGGRISDRFAPYLITGYLDPGTEWYRPLQSLSLNDERTYGGDFTSRQQIISNFNTPGYYLQEAGDMIKVYNTDPGYSLSGLFKAGFINTFDEWPRIVAKGIGLFAAEPFSKTNSKNNHLARLVEGVAESAGNALLYNFATVYGIKPSLYLGSDMDVIDARLGYVSLIKQMAYASRMEKFKSSVEGVASDINRRYKNNEISKEDAVKALTKVINEATLSGLSDDAKARADLYIAGGNLNIGETLTAKQLADKKIDMLVRERGGSEASVSVPERNEITQGFENQLRNNNVSEVFGMRNRGFTLEGILMQQLLKQDTAGNRITLSEALDNVGVSKFDLFARQAWNNLCFGMLENGIKGGIQAVFQKNFNSNSSNYNFLSAMLASTLANNVTAIARGVAWHLGWESPEAGWYRQSWVAVMPEAPDQAKCKDTLEYQSRLNTYEYEMQRYNQFVELSGATPRVQTRPTYDWALQKEVPKDFTIAEIYFKDQQPSLAQAIGVSLLQANTEALVKTWSFGMPITNPGKISSATYLEYVNALTSKAYQFNNPTKGGFYKALAASAIEANLSAATDNIGGMLSAIRPVAQLFDIMPQRLVATNLSNVPFTLQYLHYFEGMGYKQTEFMLPFPNPSYYGMKPQTNLEDYLRRTQK